MFSLLTTNLLTTNLLTTNLLHCCRDRRAETPIPVVALVGYTNAGKSTLLNTLTSAGVLAEDKLFATLDPTTRRVRLKGNKEVGGGWAPGLSHCYGCWAAGLLRCWAAGLLG